MTQPAPATPRVEVMWRPGCPFCASLRRGLGRAGVVTEEQDIWTSAEAAARVRAATGGDEVVPTVFVGRHALVNPSVAQVMAAIRSEDPDYRPTPRPAPVRTKALARVSSLDPGLVWTLLVAVAWVVLVAWRPTTTWHLAPLLTAGAWPWVVGQDSSANDPAARRRILVAGAGGLLAAAGLTTALALAGGLAGPTWTGAGTPVAEAFVLTGLGALVAVALGLLRTVRRTASASASLHGRPVASSDDVVIVEGNAYFPRESVATDALQPSSTTSVCFWKGVASYYDVHVDQQVVPDGAWTYRHPFAPARRVRGRVAFSSRIEVDRP